jgi:hypothetical protein
MPSGTAQRPSDVLKIYGGKTVEVLNTDAEGRLVLADALSRSGADEPDVLVDVATLTGSQLIALGARVGAIMSNDDALRAHIHNAANRAGEQLWPMPLPDELRKSLDSDIADIANMGERYGGMLVAGLFLRDFVPAGVRWAHLDIAGPAFNQGEAYGYTSKGGTGVPLRYPAHPGRGHRRRTLRLARPGPLAPRSAGSLRVGYRPRVCAPPTAFGSTPAFAVGSPQRPRRRRECPVVRPGNGLPEGRLLDAWSTPRIGDKQHGRLCHRRARLDESFNSTPSSDELLQMPLVVGRRRSKLPRPSLAEQRQPASLVHPHL